METSGHGANPSSVRGWNEYAVVTSLREGPKRVSALATATRLTPAALGDVLRGLQDKGWVNVSAPVKAGRGRPAQLYRLRHPRACLVGLDVGSHATRAVVVDLSGKVLSRSEDRSDAHASVAERRRVVGSVLKQAMTDAGPHPVWLTMLAVGGLIDTSGRILKSVALPEWEGRNPAALFADRLPSRSLVVNDVRAATWAEHVAGAARNHDDVMLVHLGRRPSLGLLLGGVPRRGAHGMAGDISLNPLLPSEERMDWIRRFDGEDPLGDAVRAALAGDAEALAGAVGYVESISPALALATSVVDPAVVAISGALAPLAPHFLPGLVRHVAERVQAPPMVVASALDQYATALGAALLGLRRLRDLLASPTAGVAPLTREELELRLAAAASSGVDQLQVVPSSGTVPSS